MVPLASAALTTLVLKPWPTMLEVALPPSSLDEFGDQLAGRDLRIGRGQKRAAAIQDHLQGAGAHRRAARPTP